MNSSFTVEMFASFVFLLFAFSFLACHAQSLYVQYRLDKINDRKGSDIEIIERMKMADRMEQAKNDDFYIYL